MASPLRFCSVFVRQGLKKRGFFKKRETQYLQNLAHASLQPEFFFDDGHEDVDADRNPNLCLHGVFRGPKECLDSQVLLDPFEE